MSWDRAKGPRHSRRENSGIRRKLAVAVIALGALACGAPSEDGENPSTSEGVEQNAQALGAHHAPGRQRVVKRSVEFSVRLSDDQEYMIAGELYYQRPLPRRTLQVLVHGASYDGRYWDVPKIGGERYSYAQFMARKGYAVLAIDQLGTGASSQPDGDFLNLAESTFGLQQVLSALRHPSNPTHARFRDIVLVGHSNGALTAIRTQADYGVADGLVVTGWVHGSAPPIDPAAFEPLLATPYVFVPPPIRTDLFYFSPATDPNVIEFDNTELNSPIARGQFLDLLNAQFVDPTQTHSTAVDVPVLVQVGQQDFLMGFAPLAGEVSSYPASPDLTLQSIEQAGHSLTTHLSYREGYRKVHQWIRARF